MEGAAIGQVCYVNRVPFCVLRAISDSADGSSHMDLSDVCGHGGRAEREAASDVPQELIAFADGFTPPKYKERQAPVRFQVLVFLIGLFYF